MKGSKENGSGGLVQGVHKIAVVRANAIGDFIFTLPALQALRNAYPQAEIVLLGKELQAELLRERPGPVDRVVIVPPIRGVSLPDSEDDEATSNEQEQFFTEMRNERFDIAVQLHGGGGYSNLFTSRLGARLTAGMRSKGAPALDRWIPYVYFQSEILRLLEVAALVGATQADIAPHLEVTDADAEESYQEVPFSSVSLVAIHPGAGDPRRRWAPEKFAEVGDALAEQGVQIVLVGTEREGEEIYRAAALMRTLPMNVCDRLSLGGLVGLLSRCRLVIANDSGPLHIATAVGVPTVGIFWVGNLINAGPFTRTLHRPAIAWRLDCPVCGANVVYHSCGHCASFVDDVPVQEVLGSARDLLAI